MKEVAIYSVGSLPAFAVPTESEAYWTERLSYELSYMLHEANVEGMSIQRPEPDDFTAFSGGVDTFLADFKNWVSSAYDRSNSRSLLVPVVSALPALADVAALALSGGTGFLVSILLRVGLQIIVEVAAGQANNLLSGSGSQVDLSGIETALKQAFLRSENTDAPLSVFVSESSGSPSVKLPISDVLYKALLVDYENTTSPLLAMALSNFHVRVYQEDGRPWLEFGLVENSGSTGS